MQGSSPLLGPRGLSQEASKGGSKGVVTKAPLCPPGKHSFPAPPAAILSVLRNPSHPLELVQGYPGKCSLSGVRRACRDFRGRSTKEQPRKTPKGITLTLIPGWKPNIPGSG